MVGAGACLSAGGFGKRCRDPCPDLGATMEDAGREGGTAAENGTEGEGYVLVKAAPEGEGDPAAAAAGGDREDLAASAPAMAMAVAAADEAAAPAKVSPVPVPPPLAAFVRAGVVIWH